MKHQFTDPSLPSCDTGKDHIPSSIRQDTRGSLLQKTGCVFSSDLRELARAREFVRHLCLPLPITIGAEDFVSQLELALTELLSNVICHAYHGRPQQSIRLEAETSHKKLVLSLYHNGDPFDPATAPPPCLDGSQEHGFGLYIINQCVTNITYTYNEEHGNSIVLVKEFQ